MEKKANVENSMQKKGLWILKSLLCAYLVTGVLLLILTVLLYKCGLEEKHVSAGILTVYILSTLAGGFVAGKMARVRKFVWGLGIGVLYFLLLVLISFGILPQHSGAVSSAFDRVYSLHRRWNDRRYDFVRK
ncbi:hypothetical protein HMPREF0991_01142 [Lachnospiraceae bacterium 2_1_58FAA]|uniref:TIGR04086 family membrane protein n=1 Tax=Mediterraneibacter gnavus TaxID=33038 RepID=UPI0002136EBB|nr:TIGR04086 family membrane protein [Mediterraneibacter gnavus]EGN49069.1 hypothetical protein HMPREF0991_01142 [Lachnospiraceae bacterium 2_1_58FAA]